MALTRRALKAMGIDEEKIDEIIAMHGETVDGLKAEVAKYKADAESVPELQKQLQQAQAALEESRNDGYKAKYDALKGEYDSYKREQAEKEARAAKEKAVRAYYEGKGITGKSLDIAMRASGEEIEKLEMDGETIKDASALDALVNGTFSGLVSTTTVQGAKTATPPTSTGGTMTKADIYKKDDHGRYVLSAAERQQALIENHQTTT